MILNKNSLITPNIVLYTFMAAIVLFVPVVYAETLAIITDDGTRFEATDEPCTTISKYSFPQGTYEFRHLIKGVKVGNKGCWAWAEGNDKLHIKLTDSREFFFPVEYFKPSKEAEQLFAEQAEEKRRKLAEQSEDKRQKEYIDSVYAKKFAARARDETERIAREKTQLDAAKPKTWIAHNKFGSVILTQTPCKKDNSGNVAYIRDKDNSITEACWGWRDGNILVGTDHKNYMYTPGEFVLQVTP